MKLLTKTERRLAIVNDAIAQVKIGMYQTGDFGYVKLPSLVNQLDDGSAQDFLLENNEACGICAKGALFLSAIRKENKMTIDQMLNDNSHSSIMNKLEYDNLFERENLDIVESYYEAADAPVGGEGWRFDLYFSCLYFANAGSGAYLKHLEVGEKFVKAHPRKNGSERTTRLLAILVNMSANDGIFKPLNNWQF